MRFSVITPNYNGDRFLEQTLQSVLSQANDTVELEYILVDGNSTDNSHTIIKKYAQNLARIIIEKDTGPANALNKGLAAASGDVLAWLNADDLYYPGTLQRVQQVLEKRPDAAIWCGSSGVSFAGWQWISYRLGWRCSW